jgi:hypothetical protein
MAKKMGRPPKPTGEGSPVRIDRDLYTMAKNLAGYRGSSIGEYVSTLLRPVITKEYRAMVKGMDDESEGK